MKLLLTSGGVKNTSICDALVDLLGKPIGDSSALCIPTAEYGHPMWTPASAWRFIAGRPPAPMCDLGSAIRPASRALDYSKNLAVELNPYTVAVQGPTDDAPSKYRVRAGTSVIRKPK